MSEDELYIKLNPEQIAIGRKLVEMAKKHLEHNESPVDWHMAASCLRDVPMMEEAGLMTLTRSFERTTTTCSKNDILGLIKHVEILLAGNYPIADEVDE